MSLLTLIQDAAKRVKLDSPTVVTTSTDTLVTQMRELADQVGDDLSRRADWQELRKEVTFYARATTDQGYLVSIASDFDRLVDESLWNRTQVRQVEGPITADEWQRDRASGFSGPQIKYTTRGGKLLVEPAQTSGDTLALEYISQQWCESTAGTGLTQFADDSDLVKLPERIFKLGLIAKYLEVNGASYAEAKDEYEFAIETHTGNVSGKRVLFLGGGPPVAAVNIPSNNFPTA